MNKTDRDRARYLAGLRALKAAEGHLDDLRLDEMGLVERVERDALPEHGIATTREIYEGLDL